MNNEEIKQKTLEIYESLPQEKELRKACIAERDKIIELNYSFFGYVASKTFINNTSVVYEDKFQSALMHFCECWWWYKWKGDETHKGYRQDLSFAVFFKPRIGEMIERELNEVKYSIRRSLCMEAGKQLGKHWAQVKYDDLKHVDLSPDKMNSLKAIFGSLYIADLADYEMYFDDELDKSIFGEEYSDDFDTVTGLLMHDMLLCQCKLDDSELKKMADMYDIEFELLKKYRPVAEEKIKKMLLEKQDLIDGFTS